LSQAGRHGEPIWFRGQADASWPLKPSLLRKRGGLKAEQALVKRFKQNAYLLLPPRPVQEHEWLFIMQHHGVPTRLLDWTESPLVAVYFSVVKHPKMDGTLWALLPMELNRQANIPGLGPNDIPAFDEDPFLASYVPSKLAQEPEETEQPTVAILAPRNTTRSQVQLTVFTVNHRNDDPIEGLGDARHIWRYIVPTSAKRRLREELEQLHITELSLFPELPNVGLYAKEIL
jgi:hypothetical protein